MGEEETFSLIPGETVEERIANSDGRTDGTDGIDETDGTNGNIPGNIYRKPGRLKLCIFQDHFIMGPNKQASQPAYSLAIWVDF